jgi:hypothetical protein
VAVRIASPGSVRSLKRNEYASLVDAVSRRSSGEQRR